MEGSASAYRFNEALNMTQEEAKDVSDHFPVQFDLLGKGKVSFIHKIKFCFGLATQE